MSKRSLRIAILVLSGSLAGSHALSLGIGRVPESTVFGQTLDLSVPLRMDGGEILPASCLHAEVAVGEQRLSAASLQVSIERAADGSDARSVRLSSPVVVLDPLVTVKLRLGCNATVSRKFVIFADPPNLRAEAAGTVPAAPATRATALPPALTDSTGPPAARPSPGASKAAARASRAAKAERSPRRVALAAPDTSAKAHVSASPVAPSRSPPMPERQGAAPRLKLEEPEALLKAATAVVAAQDTALAAAEKAATAAQAAASAAEGRALAMDHELQALRAEGTAQRASIEQMRLRMAQAESQSQSHWWLGLALVVLAGVTLWLGLRLRALQRERQAQWWRAGQAPVADTASEVESEAVPQAPTLSTALGATPAPLVAPTAASLAGDESALAATTDLLSKAALVGSTLTRAVSVDELIDLEQQAEFFIVLGEEGAAIELLMTHLRGSGGVSPLPYLKLLDIYRRGQDREAYERIRKRFNRRFGAVAPDWDEDLERGRGLQDYPAVLAILQAVWHAPLNTMVELENLLFRKRSSELFELPAYRDVLMLYAVARDLHRQVDQGMVDVDVLLPLGTEHDPEATSRLSIFDRLDDGVEQTAAFVGAEHSAAFVEDRVTSPVDVDLSRLDDGPESRPGELRPMNISLRRDH